MVISLRSDPPFLCAWSPPNASDKWAMSSMDWYALHCLSCIRRDVPDEAEQPGLQYFNNCSGTSFERLVLRRHRVVLYLAAALFPWNLLIGRSISDSSESMIGLSPTRYLTTNLQPRTTSNFEAEVDSLSQSEERQTPSMIAGTLVQG